MEATLFSETLVDFRWTTLRYFPENRGVTCLLVIALFFDFIKMHWEITNLPIPFLTNTPLQWRHDMILWQELQKQLELSGKFREFFKEFSMT
jgi:hypothetical protein